MDPEQEHICLSEVAAFLEKLEAALAPSFGEILSDETRSWRNATIGIALFSIFVARGFVHVTEIKPAQTATLELILSSDFMYACAALMLFLGVSYLARCYLDWVAWSLAKTKRDVQILSLESALTEFENRQAINQDAMEAEKTEIALQLPYISASKRERIRAIEEKLFKLANGHEANAHRAKAESFSYFITRATSARRIQAILDVAFPVILSVAAACANVSAALQR